MEKLSKGIRDFNQVAREIDAAYHLAAKQIGLSDSQRDILYILCQEYKPSNSGLLIPHFSVI